LVSIRLLVALNRVPQVSPLRPPVFRLACALSVLAFLATGCHSAFIQTTITNQGPTIHTLEVDYPSQSFGVQTLATNQTFHYRFKVQGSGPIKLQFQDASGKTQTSDGPTLEEGNEGTIAVTINPPQSPQWQTHLMPRQH
jgi:hypothetical protein